MAKRSRRWRRQQPAKEQRGHRQQRPRRRGPALAQRPRYALAALAGAGVLLTGYLLVAGWIGGSPAYCTQGSGCDLVQSSKWSEFLGLPVEFFGLGTYALIGALAWFGRKPAPQWKVLWLLSLVGLTISVYLTIISATVIEAFCLYCLTSLGLIAAIFVVVASIRPSPMEGFRWLDWGTGTVATALGLVAVMHVSHSDWLDRPVGENEDPYLANLADHLDDSGAMFFGASWCPHCRQQKELFGASADRLPYIECSPQGRDGPLAPACRTAQVSNYPTWQIEGERYTEVLQPERLAELSGFDWEEEQSEDAAGGEGDRASESG